MDPNWTVVSSARSRQCWDRCALETKPDVQSEGKSEKEKADKQKTQTPKRFVDDEMLE